jgi:hypothetical protein
VRLSTMAALFGPRGANIANGDIASQASANKH